MEFSREEYWSGLPFPSPGDLPNLGIKPGSPALQVDTLPSEPPGIPDYLTCLLRNLYAGQEATELDMEQQTGSKSGKEYVKTIYCHPAYLTTRQGTSCEMPDWMNLKLESRLPGEISVTSDMQMTPP